MLTSRPTIYLIGGCNCAGKTTLAKEFLSHEVKFLRFYDPQKTADFAVAGVA
jgi:uridine kinase